jgi:hypothetical protein
MKFSFRQILASAGGAVLAAVIASLFGVKGTIVGVAIGSAAATFGTAFLAQSIDRGHDVVKQVVVRVPESTPLLRRLGGTQATGVTEATRAEEPTAVQEAIAPAEGAETAPLRMEDPDDSAPTAVVPAAPSAATQHPTVVLPLPLPNANPYLLPGEALPPPPPGNRFRWPAIAGTAALVFVLSLMFVTAVELIAGRPLADLFGGHSGSNSPSVGQIFNQSPPAATSTTTTTTSPTTTTSTSSTSTTTSSTTSTTIASGGSTTTVPGSTTTTGGTASTTTSTLLSVTTTTAK